MNQPNGICIELTPTQYDYAYELIMMAYELDIPEPKGVGHANIRQPC